MRSNDIFGIVFANLPDDLMPELTSVRSVASVPFGARYRLIDFSVSNLVNAGVSRVAVITKSNYRSLMEHLGNGKAWDLDRKTNGLYIMPPYNVAGAGYSVGHIDALCGITDFIENSPMKYVVLCDANVISNIDLSAVFASHVASGSDITFCYKHGALPKSNREIMSFTFGNDSRIEDIRVENTPGIECDFCLGVIIMEKELLMNLTADAYARGGTSFARDVIQYNKGNYKMSGYEVCDYTAVMDCAGSYVAANRSLLDAGIRSQLFNPKRPVYTKVQDSMPTRYGPDSRVENCLIGDGCIIEGTVKNCILFRGVKIEKGAVAQDSIIMEDATVKTGANIRHITADKDVIITEGSKLCGTAELNLFIKKGDTV